MVWFFGVYDSQKTRLFYTVKYLVGKKKGKTSDAIFGLPRKATHKLLEKHTKNVASKIKTINQQKNTPP